ncbi:hypothetical protein NBH00_22280 [Paraconexibacter antarcticus]|uniref:SGNH domain-containing protein n=1 Tax=Paraconexibacter antarcticus TaxID=2949664 RepID=A0ABY5DSV8_9ACTN|nr:SGNH hydrolase domain-containing protein [Paraconexibacter antarcticus]UTI64051.1 hypothetical protein NBH00_22280 [Paraconexibacter antarcticus]
MAAAGARLARRDGRAVAVCGVAFTVAVAVGQASGQVTTTTLPSAATNPPCFGAAARDHQHPCSNAQLRYKVLPTPDDAVIEPNAECTPVVTKARPFVCTFGFVPPEAARADTTVALVGDSHATHWRAALDPVARSEEWAGVSLTRSSCPFSTTTPVLDKATARACVKWNPQVQAWFRRHREVSTVFTSEHIQVRVKDSRHRGQFEAKVRGYMNQWRALPSTVKHVVVIKDTPRATGNTADCVTNALHKKERAGAACAIPRSFAIKPDPAVEAVRRLHSSRYLAIDMTSYFCSARSCPPVIGGALVFKDPGHITRVYGETLGPYLQRAIEALAPFRPKPDPGAAPSRTG